MRDEIRDAVKQNTLVLHALTGVMATLRESYEVPADEVEEMLGPVYDAASEVGSTLRVVLSEPQERVRAA